MPRYAAPLRSDAPNGGVELLGLTTTWERLFFDCFLLSNYGVRPCLTYVGTGEKLAELPDLGALQARVYVLEADAGGLESGCTAQVVVEGAAGAPLTARVARVDALAKPRERGSPVRYFETVLALDRQGETVRALDGQGRGFKPGQRVRATIVLERLADVLAVPRAAVFERGGQRVVYVQQGSRVRPVAVSVGRNSPSHVVIEAGLEPGWRVLLRDPAYAPGTPEAPHGEDSRAAARKEPR